MSNSQAADEIRLLAIPRLQSVRARNTVGTSTEDVSGATSLIDEFPGKYSTGILVSLDDGSDVAL